jgi:hypothetical protein
MTDTPNLAPKEKPKRQRPLIKFSRYSYDEAAEFDRLAAIAGLSDSAFIRVSTIGEQGRPRSRRRPPSEESQLKARHMTALNRVGNNINQGTRALNEITLEARAGAGRDRLADQIETVRALLESAIPALIETLDANRRALDCDWEG